MLTFVIANCPSWLNFNPATGALTGTPSAANVGNYSNVSISVSDGNTSASLPPFSITVNPITAGSATLSWDPPTQNTDGSALSNLAGYQINYGTNAASLTQTVLIANPGTTSYVIGNLSQGTWYFTVNAFTANAASAAASSVTKVIL